MAGQIVSLEDVVAFISLEPRLVTPLEAVASLRLPDCWIAAGFIRNAVWDALHHGFKEFRPGDVDVVYFDGKDLTPKTDAAIEARLREVMPDLDWSVRNQARMHAKNGDSAYIDTSDAMRHWPETCTAIAARSYHGSVEVLAPFGVDDLTSLLVRPTPAFVGRMEIYRNRIQRKRWCERWPRLTIINA